MKKIKLFTDSSVNPQEKVGFGAYLKIIDENISFEDMKKHIDDIFNLVDKASRNALRQII